MKQIGPPSQLAKQAYARGEYKKAIRICDQLAARLGPRDDLLNIKAVSLLALGKTEEAETSIRQALRLNPRIAGIHLNAAGIYNALSQNKLVKRHAMNAVRLASRDAAVLYQAALLCRKCGDYSQALRIIDRCVQIKPGFTQAWHLKGSALIDLGKMEAAQAAMEQAVKLDPGNVKAFSSLISIRGDRPSDSETVAVLERIKLKAGSATERASAAFALGNMYRRDGQHDIAFAHYLEANSLVASHRPFDLDAWQQEKRLVMQASSRPGALIASRGSSGAGLVFIIGMPRSGTTLCEQVLSANSAVLACGEMSTMGTIESSFTRRGIDPYEDDLAAKELEQAAAMYLSTLPKNYQKYQAVTDKAPVNFERVGLIHLIFPQARFLYCTRHPLDTILSCFMQDFQSGLRFASNLEYITEVYITHAQLMRHWMERLPGQIHTVNYEQYIESQEAETRSVAEFLHLDFEQDMLAPHLQDRVVVTASNFQVRRAVYSSSINRWKNYQSQLADVITLLQRAALLDDELNSLL